MRISDWSSDVCSSDLIRVALVGHDRTAGGVLRRQRDEAEFRAGEQRQVPGDAAQVEHGAAQGLERGELELAARELGIGRGDLHAVEAERLRGVVARSEEHTSELQSLMRI